MAWGTTHHLESVQVTIHLPSSDTPDATTIEVVGRASTKRGSLWSYREVFSTDDDPGKMLGPTDVLQHLLLCVLQDEPNTQERLNYSLSGGMGYQVEELPFD